MYKILPIIAFVLILIVGGIFYTMSHEEQDSADTQGQAPMQSSGVPVSALEIKTQSVNFKHELPGRISAYRQSQIRPQVDGIIIKRLFEEGADVEKGQQLYQIDDARYKAALNSAIADLKSAEANVKTVDAKSKRYEDLIKINAVSQQEYDDTKAELDQAQAAIAVAQAAVDLAQVNLDYTKVYAPISGRISRSFITEGTLVTANQSINLATITQLDPAYIDMQQSGSEAMKLRARMVGMDNIAVTLILDEDTNTAYPHKGNLKFSEVTIDQTTGSITLRALIDNPDGLLLPGLFVRANLDLGQSEVLMVPQRATIRNADGSLSVWVIDANNTAQVRPIEVEQTYADNWVVKSGLEAGERVIVEGYQKIKAGAAVSPSPWKAAHGEQGE